MKPCQNERCIKYNNHYYLNCELTEHKMLKQLALDNKSAVKIRAEKEVIDCKLYTTEKQQSAFEMLGAIVKRFPQKNIAKALINYIPLFKKYNLSFNKAIVVLFKNYCEEDIINICKHIKQELEG